MNIRRQQGFLLIEGLIAILIFSLGILGLVAMGARAVSTQSDAQYRTFAAQLADDMANRIAIGVNRAGGNTTIQADLANYKHHSDGGDCTNSFTGGASTNADVLAWVTRVGTTGAGLPGLPGAAALTQQIQVNVAASNQVQITICWRAPSDTAVRQHTLVTYIN